MNRKERNELKCISAEQFKRALLAGIGMVLARQDYLNKINVFPVPDSDTGTNMAMTLSAIATGLSQQTFADLSTLLAVAADNALQGARGNSGAILAQFFQGMSEASQQDLELTLDNAIRIIGRGAESAQAALATPKEGTILTVLRVFSESLAAKQSKYGNLWSLFLYGLKEAEHALKLTTKQLDVLKKAGVVDAGAQGFVDFLHGIKEYVETGHLPTLDLEESGELAEEPTNIEIMTKYRYCTECLIIGENINHAELRRSLILIGDSLIVAGSATKTKVHVHVNEPDKVFEYCRQYGKLDNQKADDMIQQQKLHNKHPRVAILTDSGADIPGELIESLDIHVVPLTVHFGEEAYIDKISLTSEQFFEKLKRSPHHPKTSQPSAAEFSRQYHFLNTHYSGGILALHMSSKLSGTYGASVLGAKQITSHPVKVLDTLTCCASQGLLVTYAASLAEQGLDIDTIAKKVKQAIPKTTLYAAFPSLEYAVRGGRVSKKKKWLASLLHLTPIIGLNKEGYTESKGVLRGRKNLDKKLAEFVFKRYSPQKRYRISVVHTNSPAAGQNLLSRLISHFHTVEMSYLVNCGAVIGAHAGPGCLAVAIQELD